MKTIIIALAGFLSMAQADVVTGKAAPQYFKKSYEESRQQYLNSIETLKKLNTFEIKQQSFADPEDKTLTTDVALIHIKNAGQPEDKNQKLIMVMSGLHGIEGYVGSALQSKFIDDLPQLKNTHTDYLFVHALNPYGFKNNRRVNRNNIDLNRNFMLQENDFKIQNPAYAEINSFLNPEVPVKLNSFNKFGFILSSVKLILQYSLETLREAVLKGQYQFPNGLYFGGQQYQYQKSMVDQIVSEYLYKYNQVFTLDLHTGYGQKNKLHILAASMKQPTAEQLNKIFTFDRIDYGDKKKFYHTTGDLITYLEAKSTPTTHIIGGTFEFGTLDSQKTLGSIESLRRTVLENQNHHQAADSETTDAVNSLFQDMFYPQDETFKQQCFEQAQVEFAKIQNFFN